MTWADNTRACERPPEPPGFVKGWLREASRNERSARDTLGLETAKKLFGRSDMNLPDVMKLDDQTLVGQLASRARLKEAERGTRALSRVEHNILLLSHLPSALHFGGLRFFFEYEPGNCALRTQEALVEIHHAALGKLFARALAVFPGSIPAEDLNLRQAQIAKLGDDSSVWDALTEEMRDLDRHDALDHRIAEYAREHQAEIDLPARQIDIDPPAH